jgi:hypothetical protein
LASRVAVAVLRAAAMLAVAVQLPVGVLTDDLCGDTAGATSSSELEPEPEPNAGAASASNAQAAGAMCLIPTTKAPF